MGLVTVAESLAGLSGFLLNFVAAVVLLAVFCAIYSRVTPYSELKLIREGNTAAAISFSGAMLGFVLPLASAITNSVSFLDMLIWSGIALLVQIAVFFALKHFVSHLIEDIAENRTASATLLAVLSTAIGVLNAACMSY